MNSFFGPKILGNPNFSTDFAPKIGGIIENPNPNSGDREERPEGAAKIHPKKKVFIREKKPYSRVRLIDADSLLVFLRPEPPVALSKAKNVK